MHFPFQGGSLLEKRKEMLFRKKVKEICQKIRGRLQNFAFFYFLRLINVDGARRNRKK
jgi:hypothetical protein